MLKNSRARKTWLNPSTCKLRTRRISTIIYYKNYYKAEGGGIRYRDASPFGICANDETELIPCRRWDIWQGGCSPDPPGTYPLHRYGGYHRYYNSRFPCRDCSRRNRVSPRTLPQKPCSSLWAGSPIPECERTGSRLQAPYPLNGSSVW